VREKATSEILRVISSSPTDVQPVFDTIAQSAARLCKAQFCQVFRFDGELIHLAGSHGLTPSQVSQDQWLAISGIVKHAALHCDSLVTFAHFDRGYPASQEVTGWAGRAGRF